MAKMRLCDNTSEMELPDNSWPRFYPILLRLLLHSFLYLQLLSSILNPRPAFRPLQLVTLTFQAY